MPTNVPNMMRRRLLQSALIGTGSALLSSQVMAGTLQTRETSNQQDTTAFLAGNSVDGTDSFSCVLADAKGAPIYQWPLPGRAHGVAMMAKLHHTHHLVSFARRPGSFFSVFDYQNGELITQINADEIQYQKGESYFYGHGVYTPDHQYLLATQGVKKTSEGFIGVYQVDLGYQKVDEWHDIGIGPHEIIRLAEGGYAVGVGGVHTQDRQPLNIETMQPALVRLDAQGKRLGSAHLSDHKLSIRHLSQDLSTAHGVIACGQQYRGDPDDYPSLIALWHQGDSQLTPLNAEPEQWARFNHYIASIAIIDDYLLATSPRGNCYGIWSISQNALLSLNPLSEASGVLVQDKQFMVSSGAGRIVRARASQEISRQIQTTHWDNHWLAIPT